MFITFKCHECNSIMKLDFHKFSARAHETGVSVKCQACGNSFPGQVSYELHQFILAYNNFQPKWDVEFTLPVDKQI
jgi:transcription elongation factor Elf1